MPKTENLNPYFYRGLLHEARTFPPGLALERAGVEDLATLERLAEEEAQQHTTQAEKEAERAEAAAATAAARAETARQAANDQEARRRDLAGLTDTLAERVRVLKADLSAIPGQLKALDTTFVQAVALTPGGFGPGVPESVLLGLVQQRERQRLLPACIAAVESELDAARRELSAIR